MGFISELIYFYYPIFVAMFLVASLIVARLRRHSVPVSLYILVLIIVFLTILAYIGRPLPLSVYYFTRIVAIIAATITVWFIVRYYWKR
jgi:hypothetical protein